MKSVQNTDPKAAKRRRFVAGLIDGKSMRKAALEAGYTQSMANNAGKKIFPGARREFQKALGRKMSRGPLLRRISEGLDAIKTELCQHEGRFTDEQDVVDWSERRRMVELACRLMGYMVERVEVGNRKEVPSNFDLSVLFSDPNPEPRKATPE